ncbi:hypothetical protein [Photobacterium damselae]|uniref:hypothetical protein n=1 Tax=Photobacterium damselae TaxID=38293 RepID=UPI0040676524
MSIFTSFIQDKTITANTDYSALAVEYANHVIATEKPSYSAWDESAEWDSKTLSKAIESALEVFGTEDSSSITFKEEFENQLIEQSSHDIFAWLDDKRHSYIKDNVEMCEQEAIGYLSALIPSFDADEFECVLVGTINDHLIYTDQSSISDTLGNREYIEIAFSPAMNTTIEYESYCCSVETAFLSENTTNSIDPSIKALFELANVSPLAFSKHLQSKGYEEEIIEKYRAIDHLVTIDTERQQALSCTDIVDVLDNATYGGTAVVFGFIDAMDFINNYDDGKTVIITGNPQIGVVDWANGSGYLAGGNSVKVVLNPQNISLETSHHYSVDSIFGFSVRSTLINLK